VRVTFDTNNYIEWTYDAAGNKIGKYVQTYTTFPTSYTYVNRYYVRGLEYANGGTPEAIYFAEGRINFAITPSKYEYTLTDHLGNARVQFSDKNNDGTIQPATELIQANHYYPFGLNQEGPWAKGGAAGNKYQYNSKELNEDFGLGWNDYGARMYDAAIGRWNTIDPLAEKYNSWSPYNYALNNSIRFIDPDGMAIINGYEKGLNEAKASLSTAEGNLEKFEGDKDSKAYRKLEKNVRNEKNHLANVQEKYDVTNKTINELRDYNAEEYSSLDNLADGVGNAVDVYVYVVAPYSLSSDQQEGISPFAINEKLSGFTDSKPNTLIQTRQYGSDVVKPVYSIKSQNGVNSVTILIDGASNTSETLAHEGGHTIYTVSSMYSYLQWLRANPSKSSGGHGGGNPSGEAADREQATFNQNKARAKN
jgi:RHS repeat-associated protein